MPIVEAAWSEKPRLREKSLKTEGVIIEEGIHCGSEGRKNGTHLRNKKPG